MQTVNIQTHCSLPWSRFDSMFGSFCCKNTLHRRFSSFDEIQKSKHVQQIKNDLLAGIKNQACNQCWQEDAADKLSTRKISLQTIGGVNKSEQDLLHEIENNKLRQLILYTGNSCNLACRTCGGNLSSTHTVEAKAKKLKDPRVHIHPITKPDFTKYLNQDYSCLESIHVMGGEPLLNVEHTVVLEKISQDGHANKCHLTYNTNGTHALSKKHYEILHNFGTVNFVFSIDAVGEQFNYLRTGADWQLVTKNIKEIRQSLTNFPNSHASVHLTISVLNILYLEELYAWLENQDLEVHFNFCFYPQHYSFELFNTAQKQYVDYYLSQSKYDMTPIRNFLKNSQYNADLQHKFWREVDWTHEYHNMALDTYLPKLAKLLG